MNIFEDMKQILIQQLFAISSKIFTTKLQFLPNTVADMHFFPLCNFQTLQSMSSRSKRLYSPNRKCPFLYLEMHCKVQK